MLSKVFVFRPRRQSAAWFALSIMAALTTGCSNNAPQTVPFHGKLVYQGKPVPKGVVYFDPLKVAEGLPFRPAQGVIGEDGSFTMSTFAAGDGVVPGEYRVRIIATNVLSAFEDPVQRQDWLIPKKYGDSTQNALTVNISTEDDAIEKTFELQD